VAVSTGGPPRTRVDLKGLIYRPEVRQIAWQVALLLALVFAFGWVVQNVAANLRRQNIASGFEFLDRISGFDVAQSLIEYSNVSTYGRAFWVGLLNTLLVAVLGIVFATLLGFVIGIARLSSNWLIAKLAAAYVEIVRNIPLLLQLCLGYSPTQAGLMMLPVAGAGIVAKPLAPRLIDTEVGFAEMVKSGCGGWVTVRLIGTV